MIPFGGLYPWFDSFFLINLIQNTTKQTRDGVLGAVFIRSAVSLNRYIGRPANILQLAVNSTVSNWVRNLFSTLPEAAAEKEKDHRRDPYALISTAVCFSFYMLSHACCQERLKRTVSFVCSNLKSLRFICTKKNPPHFSGQPFAFHVRETMLLIKININKLFAQAKCTFHRTESERDRSKERPLVNWNHFFFLTLAFHLR